MDANLGEDLFIAVIVTLIVICIICIYFRICKEGNDGSRINVNMVEVSH